MVGIKVSEEEIFRRYFWLRITNHGNVALERKLPQWGKVADFRREKEKSLSILVLFITEGVIFRTLKDPKLGHRFVSSTESRISCRSPS